LHSKFSRKSRRNQKLSKAICGTIHYYDTDLLEEAGEVAAAVKGLEGYKPPDKPKTRDMLAAEPLAHH